MFPIPNAHLQHQPFRSQIWFKSMPCSASVVLLASAYLASAFRQIPYQVSLGCIARIADRRHPSGRARRGRSRLLLGSPTALPDAPDAFPAEIRELQRLFAAVAALDRVPIITDRSSPSSDDGGILSSVDEPTKPTFRRLFTHETWRTYLGGSTLARWRRCMRATPSSVILRSIWRMIALASAYSLAAGLCISWLRNRIPGGMRQTMPLSICGNAIGLLLVFRTNNAYRRLEEARELCGQVLHFSREIVSRTTILWKNTTEDATGGLPTSAVALVCRYVAAFCWAFRDEYRDGNKRCEIMELLLPKRDAQWVLDQPSRPMAVHGLLRQHLYNYARSGEIPDQMHFFLESDLGHLAQTASSCERVFTSPIPPTMTRHGLRSLTLWFLALPAVMAANQVQVPLTVAWTAAIAFIYVGIEELGVQVEQPFQIIPLWQLCTKVQKDIEELVVHSMEASSSSSSSSSSSA